MSRAFHLSSWMYERLLFLYPQDLRRDFGNEMVLAFAADLEAGGMIRSWWCAARELLTVALPGQSSNPCVLVPALSFALAASTQSAELWVSLHHVTRLDRSMLLDSIRLAVLLPSVANACVACVVTRFCSRCSINALRLG